MLLQAAWCHDCVTVTSICMQVVLDRDMVCQGQVVYTGGSSLDIRMELLQVRDKLQPFVHAHVF